MLKMSKPFFVKRWILCVPLVLLPILLLQGLSAEAAPPAAPRLGITPTPTFTPTPTLPPTPLPAPTPGAKFADPVITKLGGPEEAFPGEEVTFTLQATNKGQNAAVDVVITDDIPKYLEILQVTTTQGTVTIAGQTVTVNVGVIGPGFVVEVVIRTRVREDAPAPLQMENVAVLKSPNSGERTSPPVIIYILAPMLPKTGGATIPWLAYAVLGSVLAALAARLVFRTKN